ncbi:MAG: M23 family metallopeptidase [Flavobacteriales bacterium]|nr:M23 family metallopeptidase [Flavobacteriales bacterium]MCB9449562.1 M23 family metallopeptidase [Flavobacteriales bacterium]
MNDSSFEEKLSIRLTPLNVYTLIGASIIVLITLGITLVAFTPLRQYVPGYTTGQLRKQSLLNTISIDSLQDKLRMQEQYLNSLRDVLSGNDSTHVQADGNTPANNTTNYEKLEISKSDAEKALIEKIESEDKYNLAFNEPVQHAGSKVDQLFYCPLKGLITSRFDALQKHFGIDVVAKKDEPVKATLNGKVILATWTSETGYVIALQHKGNLVSFYKHNSVLLKKVGEFVRAGEAIAIVGDSGELTSGPHLHFELWHDGQAINPEDYMVF